MAATFRTRALAHDTLGHMFVRIVIGYIVLRALGNTFPSLLFYPIKEHGFALTTPGVVPQPKALFVCEATSFEVL